MSAKTAPAKEKSDVYNEIEMLLKKYSPPFSLSPSPKVGSKRHYGLESKKEVEIAGRKFPEVCFAAVIEQKGYVGFYYMPIYMNPKLAKDISPRLMKLLKGKSCFHIKTLDADLLRDIKSALDLAAKHFKKSGWV